MHHGEQFNSFTHFTGLVQAMAGGAVLITQPALHGDARKIVGSSIFSASVVLLYGASSLYHSVRGKAKKVLVKLDHCAINLLIAGAYTPFALVTSRGPWGWSLCGVVWGLAVLGIIMELCFWRDRFPSVPLYRGSVDIQIALAPGRPRVQGKTCDAAQAACLGQERNAALRPWVPQPRG